MPVARTVWGHKLLKRQEHVVRNGWVSVFVDGNGRSSMGAIDNNIAVSNPALADKRADPAGNINHLVAALGADAKIFLGNFHFFLGLQD